MNDINDTKNENITQKKTEGTTSMKTQTTLSKRDWREFYVGNNTLNQQYKFPNNFIKTSRYNWINFLPKCLLLQFKRYANIYFLIVAVLQSIPQISPLNAFSAIAPLVFVLTLSILREGYEDIVRHRSDEELNSSHCLIYRNGEFKQCAWKEIQVGDIVKVMDSDFFPADLILLDSNNENGVCYIETSSLDGEKNLKPKNAAKETVGMYNPSKPILRLECKMSCQQPNPELYSFGGILILANTEKIILNAKQLLLRGAKLKNTEWIIGIVVYTGIDSKIMKNSEQGRNKQSNIERLSNKLIIELLFFQLGICLISAIGCLVWDLIQFWPRNHFIYLSAPYKSGLDAFISFWSYFLLNNTMIPISLIVSLELVKLAQAYFIEKDIDIYNARQNRFAKVFTSSINEELGQVEYVFSDKTGTLTCNRMEFKICIIGYEMYGDSSMLLNAGTTVKRLVTHSDKKGGVDFSFQDKNLTNYLTNLQQNDAKVNLEIRGLGVKNQVLYEFKKQSELVKEFILILATCHDCLVEKNKESGNITYQGPSPDEITLVDAANRLGYKFLGGSQNFKKVEIDGKETDFEILQSFEFDSDRKRMSVIIKDKGVIKLFIKGADSIIISRLRKDVQQPYLKNIEEKLNEFSKRGLRTLCIAMKVISKEEYQEFDNQYRISATFPDKEQRINRLADELEKNLYLIGATAVEDKLQDNVPETIYDMIKANIKVWMLTGDKLETAENIGRSCNLVQPDFKVLQVSEKNLQAVKLKLEEHEKTYEILVANKKKKSMLIEGESLGLILGNPELKSKLLHITKGCEAVICCRVTPKQKADVVRLIKDGLGRITLGIGDGANDVNMIQEAHIGIGIYGQEGMRAVQASDYALPEFQGLWRLLFVHGRWSYIRISEMILYFFYKNMLFTIPQFYFSFACGFSGQSIFDDWFITFYNLIFTALPLVMRAVFEKDVDYKNKKVVKDDSHNKANDDPEYEKPYEIKPLLRKYYPLLYEIGQKDQIFNPTSFYSSLLQGILHAVLIFCIAIFAMPTSGLNARGYDEDIWYFSITLYTGVIFVVDIKLAIHTKYWTILSFIALVITSIGFYFGYVWLSDQVIAFGLYKTAEMLFTTHQFYLSVLLSTCIVFAADYAFLALRNEYKANIIDKFKKIIKSHQEDNEEVFKTYIDKEENVNQQVNTDNQVNMEKQTSMDKKMSQEKQTDDGIQMIVVDSRKV